VAVWCSGKGDGRISEVTLRRARLVLEWVGDRLRTVKPTRYVTNRSGQLSLLLSAGRKISTGQSVVMLRD